jgi:hypothetical protein
VSPHAHRLAGEVVHASSAAPIKAGQGREVVAHVSAREGGGAPYPQHGTHWGHRLGWREVPARTPAVVGRMPTRGPLGTQAEKQRRPPMGSTEVKQRVQEREALPKNDFRR